MHLKMSPGIWRPFCLGLNVLSHRPPGDVTEILKAKISGLFWWNLNVLMQGIKLVGQAILRIQILRKYMLLLNE